MEKVQLCHMIKIFNWMQISDILELVFDEFSRADRKANRQIFSHYKMAISFQFQISKNVSNGKTFFLCSNMSTILHKFYKKEDIGS